MNPKRHGEEPPKVVPDNDYDVGYKRPSKAHQFPKGYCPKRNYRGRPKKKKSTLAEEVEKAFATAVRVRLKPSRPPETITAFELILARLFEKATKGDNAALKVLEKYEIYAASKPIVKIVEDRPSDEELANSYAAMLAAEEAAAEACEGPREFEIDGDVFTSDSNLREVSEAYYRWFDEWNKPNEKKIQRRRLV